MTHPSIDAVITAAARSIVAHDPSPAFEWRLGQRLDDRPRRRWLFMAVPVVATLVAAVVSSLPDVEPELPQTAPAPRTVVAAAPELRLPDESATWMVAQPASTSDVVEAHAPGAAASPASAAEAAWAADAVPTLAAPAALAVAVTQPDVLSIPLLEVGELVAPGLSIPPISTLRAPRIP